MAVIQLG